MHRRPPRADHRLPRGVLALLGLTLVTGCSTAAADTIGSAGGQSSGASSSSPARPLAAAVSSPRLAPAAYTVPAGESYPATKRAAVRAALALTNYPASATPLEIARAVTPDPAAQRALQRAAAPLYHRGATSAGTVVYPQMGGITTDLASVMVVVRQTVTSARTRVAETRTLDIRLALTGGRWHFAELASAGGTPIAPPANLSPEARAVLNDPRIALPDSARWDIYRGAISPTLLHLMMQIAARAPYQVTVLETGHPYDVFGTTHQSMHSAGRAVDINFYGGRHVVDQRGVGSPAYRLVQWLLTRPEVGQVGSPWDLDGASGRSFTNGVHLDHIHISV